jgi:hypothetical protein
MKCLSLTKRLNRCKNEGNFLFCAKHKYQRLTYSFAILTFIGLTSGIFQDLVKPLSAWKGAPKVTCEFILRDTSHYSVGKVIDGIIWQAGYEKYELLIENKSGYSLHDFNVISSLPGFVIQKGIVQSKTVASQSIEFKNYDYECEIMEKQKDGSFTHSPNIVNNRLDLFLSKFDKNYKIGIWFYVKRINVNGKLIVKYFTEVEKENGHQSASDILCGEIGASFYLSSKATQDFRIGTRCLTLDKTTLTINNPSKTIHIPEY